MAAGPFFAPPCMYNFSKRTLPSKSLSISNFLSRISFIDYMLFSDRLTDNHIIGRYGHLCAFID